MKKLLVGILILLCGNAINAQISTNKSGRMLGEPYFNIKCKSEEGLVKYDILNLLFTVGDEQSAAVFKLKEVPAEDKSLQKQIYIYKSKDNLAKKVLLTKKVLRGSSGLVIDKDSFLKLRIAADLDLPNASLMFVEICEDGEHVRFYDGKKEPHFDDAKALDHYTLTDIKYLTLIDTPDGKRITFKSKPEGDQSMWKLFRVQ